MTTEAPALGAVEEETVGPDQDPSLGLIRLAISSLSDRMRRTHNENDDRYTHIDAVRFAVGCGAPEQFKSLVDVSWDDSVPFSNDRWQHMISEEDFGSVVRSFRQQSGLTLEGVAQNSQFIGDWNANLVACIEGNLCVPRADALVDYMDALHVDPRSKTGHLMLLKSIQSPQTMSLETPSL